MSLPGRNDPCPCGSGKKYKRCHGATSPIPVDSGYDRVRGLIQEANLQILEFSTRRYGPPEMQAAWDEFLDGKGGQVSGSHPDFHYFLSWFAYDWNPGGKPPLAKAYLSDRSSRNIDAGLRRLIEATLASPYSFYQALESDPGAGFKARDVLREIEVDITERGASTQIVKGMIMFARVVSLDGISFLMSTGMRPLSAVALAEIQNIREDLFSAGRIRSEAERTEILLDEEDYLRGAYFGIADAEERSVTDIRNTDGDPLVLHSLRYSIPAFQPAFDALKSLELRGTPGNEDELLTEKEITKDGEKIRARIHWLKRDKKGEQGRSVIAVISLTDKAMIVDVNSERRSKLVKKEIRKRLGDSAILTHIDVTPAEGMLKESMKKPLRGTSMPVSEKERHLLDSPELQNALKGMAQKHWDAWPDTPVPALRGMTPRQAAKDKLGRELLESLLMEYEMRSAGTGDEFTKVDVDELRRALGLAASPASAQGELIFPNQNVRPTSPDSRILPASQARR
ncbi:MAG TPA: SEC-C domain-containing protein, partial [Bacteroidota bacterium]|nr:SEC-C domain-containing protein [Bacteroidota bacterium]